MVTVSTAMLPIQAPLLAKSISELIRAGPEAKKLGRDFANALLFNKAGVATSIFKAVETGDPADFAYAIYAAVNLATGMGFGPGLNFSSQIKQRAKRAGLGETRPNRRTLQDERYRTWFLEEVQNMGFSSILSGIGSAIGTAVTGLQAAAPAIQVGLQAAQAFGALPGPRRARAPAAIQPARPPPLIPPPPPQRPLGGPLPGAPSILKVLGDVGLQLAEEAVEKRTRVGVGGRLPGGARGGVQVERRVRTMPVAPIPGFKRGRFFPEIYRPPGVYGRTVGMPQAGLVDVVPDERGRPAKVVIYQPETGLITRVVNLRPRRKMNYLNLSALKRAHRRTDGFERLIKRHFSIKRRQVTKRKKRRR